MSIKFFLDVTKYSKNKDKIIQTLRQHINLLLTCFDEASHHYNVVSKLICRLNIYKSVNIILKAIENSLFMKKSAQHNVLYPSMLLAVVFPVCTGGCRSSGVQPASVPWGSATFLVCRTSHAAWQHRFPLLSPRTSGHFWALRWLLQLCKCKRLCPEVHNDVPMGLNQAPPLKILPKAGLAKELDLAKDLKNHNNCFVHWLWMLCFSMRVKTEGYSLQNIRGSDSTRAWTNYTNCWSSRTLSVYSLPYIFHQFQMWGKRECYCQNIIQTRFE